MSDQSRCGPHAQIANNDHVRISQCPCGAYHLTFVKRGVSIQIALEDVKALAEGMGVAVRVAEAEVRGRMLADGTGSSVN